MKLFALLVVVLVVAGGVWYGVSQLPGTSDGSGVAGETEVRVPEPYGNRIEIYDGILIPENETTVDVSGQGLSGSLKAEIRQLSKLEVLDVSDNNFTGLPAEVGQLSQLRVLNLANNPFTGLPREIGNLQNLETLDLRGTDYSEQDLTAITAALPSSTTVLVE